MGTEDQDQTTSIDQDEVQEILQDAQELDVSEKETPQESVRKALQDLQTEQDARDQDPQATEPTGEPQEPNQEPVKTKGKKGATQDEEVLPPQRLNAADKEVFNKLPARLRAATARMFKDVEATFTRTQQEAQALIQENQHLIQSVRPYYTSNPDLAASGISEAQLITALIGAHQKLTNPKTDKQAIEKLASDRGYKIQFIGDDGAPQQSQSPQQVNVQSSPEFQAMQNELQQIREWRRAQEEAQVSSQAHQITSEMQGVMEEKDQFGRYRYPEMHEQGFFEQAKPLVSALIGTIPGLSYGEALKRAYSSMTGKPIGNSNQPNQARFPSNNQQNRAVTAAVSVRGKSSPTFAPMTSDLNVPKNETPAESARIALEELRRGFS